MDIWRLATRGHGLHRSSLTTGRIAAAHRQFSGIRKVTPVCTPPNTCFLGPTQVLNPNGISIGSAFFAGLTTVTDRPTDRTTRSTLTIVRIYVRSTAMQPEKVKEAYV